MEECQGPANQGDNYHGPTSGGTVGGRNNINNISNHYHASNRDLLKSDGCRSTPFIEVPLGYLSAHFTGREVELAKVEELLGGSVGGSPTRCVIHGMPGLGKTQLSLQFAKRAYERKLYTHILWISATSEEKLTQGYCRVLDVFGHQDRLHSDQSVKLSAAQRWLEVYDGGWLLIFDNVGGTTLDFLRQHLPRQNSRGKMLFTTRTEDIGVAVAKTAGQQHHILELQPLNLRDATSLLLMEAPLSHSGTPNTAQAEALARRVGCLPLMVSQAASLVRAHKTLDILLDMDQRQQNLQIIGWENKLTNYEATSVKTVFLRQFEELERQSLTTSHLMRVLSFLDPERIPLSILEAGAAKLLDISPPAFQPEPIHQGLRRRGDKADPFPFGVESLLMLIRTPGQLQVAVQQLRDLSLVGYQSERDAPTIRIHDVIQAAVQDLGSQAGDQQDWFQVTALLICTAFSLIEHHDSVECWVQCEALAPHVQSLSRWNDVHCMELSILLSANHNVALFFQSKGRYHEAETLYIRVLDGKEKQLGVDHPSTLATVGGLADVYMSQGRYREAEPLCLRALQGQEKQRDIDTSTAVNNLAHVYSSQGRYKEAEALFMRALEGREKQLGVEDLHTLITVNLAGVYSSQGRYKDAEALHMQALEGQEKQLGVGHSHTLITVNNLARVYSLQGRYSEAETLYLRALEGREKQLGVEHPHTLITVDGLASVCSLQGRYSEAETLHLRALEGQEKQLGVEHPSTLATVNNLAHVHFLQGRYKEAGALHLRALGGQEKQLGVEHPQTLTTMDNLANAYQSQGQYEEAQALHIWALEGRGAHLGVEHPFTLTTKNNLARVYLLQGRFSEAETLHVQALEGLQMQLGVDHPDTLVTANNLARVYSLQGRHSEAETLHLRALGGQEKHLGVEHPQTLTTVDNLANAYQAQGRDNEAEALYIRALEGRKNQLGPEHPDTLSTANSLAECQSHGTW